jgi:CDP-diacylglycerol diphosphatase
MQARLRPIVFRGSAAWAGAGLAGVLIIAAATFAVRAADRTVLWRIVHEKCVPDQQANKNPAPCVMVDLSGSEEGGVAILKDINGIAQHLAIPTRRIAGVESPDLLDPGLPNYWRSAGAARSYLNARLPHELPRDAIGLAINAASRRSQDQLHIHIDCVAPDVRDALAAYGAKLSADWHVLPFTLRGGGVAIGRGGSIPPICRMQRPSGCWPMASRAQKAIWRRRRWSLSARLSHLTAPASSCSPTAPTPAPAAMARISSIRAARSPAQAEGAWP